MSDGEDVYFRIRLWRKGKPEEKPHNDDGPPHCPCRLPDGTNYNRRSSLSGQTSLAAMIETIFLSTVRVRVTSPTRFPMATLSQEKRTANA